jgi:hypothetical protein
MKWREDELSMLEFNLLPALEQENYRKLISQLESNLLTPVDKFILKTAPEKLEVIFSEEIEG